MQAVSLSIDSDIWLIVNRVVFGSFFVALRNILALITICDELLYRLVA